MCDCSACKMLVVDVDVLTFNLCSQRIFLGSSSALLEKREAMSIQMYVYG